MSAPDRQGQFTYSVRVSRSDKTILQEIHFADLQEALSHFHGLLRHAPQPRVYVQLCQYAGAEPEILETGFYFGPAGTRTWYDE
jgi:hypothetical protein